MATPPSNLVRSDFTGLTDWYVDYANLNIDPAFQNYFLQDPKDIDIRRFNAYRYFINFYKGRHWDEVGEWNPAFGMKSAINENFNRRAWNHARNVAKKLVSFTVKESWTVKLPEELETQQEAVGDGNNISKTLDRVWIANNRETFNYRVAYMACVTGDCFVRVSYDADFYAPGVGELKFEVLDSRTVLPFWDANDRQRMIGCRIQYPVFQIQSDGSKEQMTYTEVHTANTIAYFLNGQLTDLSPNPLGELLIVHIKNEPLPWERFGTSDLYDLILPQKEFNEKASDLSEILAYHAAPVTIIKGARVQNLERGARKVWGGIPKDGDVKNLDLPSGGAEAAANYLVTLKQHILETGNTPEEALGSLQNVSNTSGAALQVHYQPLLERVLEKQHWYGQGLVHLNSLILKFEEATGQLTLPNVPPALKYRTIINWGNPLPRDSSIELSDLATEIGLGIQSKRGALKELGEENPDAKLKEIQEEQIHQAQMDFMTSGIQSAGDPSAGPGGSPDSTPGSDQGDDNTGGSAPGAELGPRPDVQGAVAASRTNTNVQGNMVSQQAVKHSAQTRLGNNSSN